MEEEKVVHPAHPHHHLPDKRLDNNPKDKSFKKKSKDGNDKLRSGATNRWDIKMDNKKDVIIERRDKIEIVHDGVVEVGSGIRGQVGCKIISYKIFRKLIISS